MNPLPAKNAAAKAFNTFNLATFTIPAKQTNTITVTVQLLDAHGKAIAEVAHCFIYLSDNADGSTLTGTATTSSIAINTNGALLLTVVADKMVQVISDITGKIGLDIIQTAGGTKYYMVVVKPDGGLLISSAITF